MNSERDTQREQEEKDRRREGDEGSTFDTELHNMGGDIGPASMRGSNIAPGGKRDDDGEPKSGYAKAMGYVTGRDDEWPVTAGSDEKAVASRTDEIEDHEEALGPSPHPMRSEASEQQGEGGDPGFRIRGPVDERLHGVVDEEEGEPGAGVSDADVTRPTAGAPRGGDHVSGDLEWVPSDEDDPDSGSGRTGADDGGYLPGEETGRPYRE